MRLHLTIERERFAQQLCDEVIAGGLTVVDTIERLIAERLEDSVAAALAGRLIKAPRATVHPHYFKDRFENLSGLAGYGYSTWYPELKFASAKSDSFDIEEVDAEGFNLEAISYGGGIKLAHRHTVKELKTQTNHTIRLNKLSIPAGTFADAISLLQRAEIEQPRIANLAVGFINFVDDRIAGFRAVSFDHVISGDRMFCGCHREAHEAMLAAVTAEAPSFVADSWPHSVLTLLQNADYADSLCHFCVGQQHGEDAIGDWYGPQITQHYRPVEAFGGTEAFARTQERDERKRALCEQNGVTVVDVRYDAPLTLPSLRSRLQRWLN